MRRIWFLLSFFCFMLHAYSQIPPGYYDQAYGKYEQELKTALFEIISDGHTSNTYSSLWEHFQRTDKSPADRVWDMYSTCNFEFVTDQCGNYSAECDCYNREHSLPVSWMGGANQYPMYADLHHIVPVDAWTNNKRGSYPFGSVGAVSWTSQNGTKLGTSNYPGYSGTVFEPIDQYKGDFARIMFYMVTRYENLLSFWETNEANAAAVLDGEIWPGMDSWAISLYLEWHIQDPPDQKELMRNDSVFAIQNNRNPFIDFPVFAHMIWGPDAGLSGSSDIYPVVFPNPVADYISIQSPYDYEMMAVYDLTGRIHFEAPYNSQNIDVSFLENGLYLLRLTGESQPGATVYFIRQ
jgi:endonuclease I